MQQPKTARDKPSSIRDFVYSSEVKTRDQLMLRNIVALDEAGVESRNFQSQHSTRLYKSNSRPTTSNNIPYEVTGQRVRLFLQDENKKNKMQT